MEKTADGTGSGAGWPTFLNAVVRDYGPLRADEFAVFMRITSRAGWDGEWCKESAKQTAEAFADMSDRVVLDVRALLVEARLIEKKSAKGHRDEFRPRSPSEWVDPLQLPIIRDRIYKYRNPKKKRAALDNVAVLSMKSKDIEKRQGEQHEQLSLVSLSTVFDFTVDDSMHDWAAAECPQVVQIDQATRKFIKHLEEKVRAGWDVSGADLREEWKQWVRKAQSYVLGDMQKGRANVARAFNANRSGANQTRGDAAGSGTVGSSGQVPRFGGSRRR